MDMAIRVILSRTKRNPLDLALMDARIGRLWFVRRINFSSPMVV